jgi:hypothetical protein
MRLLHTGYFRIRKHCETTNQTNGGEASLSVAATCQSLKEATRAVPILSYPQSGERFVVNKDANNARVGRMLSQT